MDLKGSNIHMMPPCVLLIFIKELPPFRHCPVILWLMFCVDVVQVKPVILKQISIHDSVNMHYICW